MPIEFRCSGCGNLLRVPTEAVGKQARCPACGLVLAVPAPGDAFSGDSPSQPENAYRSPVYGGLAGVAEPSGGSGGVASRVEFGDIFSRTWEVFKSRWGACLLGFLCFLLLSFIFGGLMGLLTTVLRRLMPGQGNVALIELANQVATWIVSAWLSAGLLQYFLRVARGEPTGLDILLHGGPFTVRVLIVNFLVGLIVTVGFLLLIIPGVILGLMLWPAIWLVVDRNASVTESFEMSRLITAGNKWTMFLVFLTLTILGGLIVLVTFGLGTFVVGPFAFLLMAVAYLSMSGQWRQ